MGRARTDSPTDPLVDAAVLPADQRAGLAQSRAPGWQRGDNTPPGTNRTTRPGRTARRGMPSAANATERDQPQTTRLSRNEGVRGANPRVGFHQSQHWYWVQASAPSPLGAGRLPHHLFLASCGAWPRRSRSPWAIRANGASRRRATATTSRRKPAGYGFGMVTILARGPTSSRVRWKPNPQQALLILSVPIGGLLGVAVP